MSFAELVDRIRCAAGAFADLGVEKGERVAIWAPNSAEWIIAAFGLLTAGGVLVPVNTRFKAEEAADIIGRSGAKAVLVQKGFLGQDYTGACRRPASGDRPEVRLPVQRFTIRDGTVERHRHLRHHLHVGHDRQAQGRDDEPPPDICGMYEEWATLADLREGDRYLMINPYFHTFGLKAGLHRVVHPRRDDAAGGRSSTSIGSWNWLRRERITMLPGPPTLYHSLLTVADKSKLATLRAGVTGAADIPVELIRRVHDELPFQTLMTGYGLTEAGNVTLSRPGDSFEDVATTAGLPCDGVEVRIADDGEVLVRGYNVMQGYLDDPVATAEAIDADGWLHTGDLGDVRRRRPAADRRPQEGHVHRRRLQRLPRRDRGLSARASGRRPGRGDRGARRPAGPGRQGVRRAQGAGYDDVDGEDLIVVEPATGWLVSRCRGM